MSERDEALEWLATLEVAQRVKLSRPGVRWTVASISSSGFSAKIKDQYTGFVSTRYVEGYNLIKAYRANKETTR